jgi:hypothetical protein
MFWILIRNVAVRELHLYGVFKEYPDHTRRYLPEHGHLVTSLILCGGRDEEGRAKGFRAMLDAAEFCPNVTKIKCADSAEAAQYTSIATSWPNVHTISLGTGCRDQDLLALAAGST